MLRYQIVCLTDYPMAPRRLLSVWFTLSAAHRQALQEHTLNPNYRVRIWDAQNNEWVN